MEIKQATDWQTVSTQARVKRYKVQPRPIQNAQKY